MQGDPIAFCIGNYPLARSRGLAIREVTLAFCANKKAARKSGFFWLLGKNKACSGVPSDANLGHVKLISLP